MTTFPALETLTATEQHELARCWTVYETYLAQRPSYPRDCTTFFAALAIGRYGGLAPSLETPARVWPSVIEQWWSLIQPATLTLADKARALIRAIQFAEWVIVQDHRPTGMERAQ